MNDFVLMRKGRNMLSSVLHVVLNIMLAVGCTAVTIATASPVLGILLVLLSKWRMLAVQPRYWFLNIKSNTVDILVGISLVLLMYYAGDRLVIAHLVWAAIYVAWLLVIKPKSSSLMTEIQALTAVFLGMSAGSIAAASLNPIVIVLVGFVVGYSVSRHVLVQSEDHDFTLIMFVCGLLKAQTAWLLHHWLIMYSFGASGLVIPQLAVITTVVTFLFLRVYKSLMRHDGKVKVSEVAMPVIFSGLVITVMLLWFSEPIFNV
jgi:hypothetical protein